MKNLRIAKKNPSKILKIIDMQPATYRYVSSNEPISMTLRTNHIDMISHSKQHKKFDSSRQTYLKHSPSRSQKIIQVKSIPKNGKVRNRSLGSSHQAIKNQEDSSTILRLRKSHQLRQKQEHSPYIKKAKFRDSQKILNFHSVSLNQRARRQEKQSKQKQSTKNVTKKRGTHLKFQYIEDMQHQNKTLQNNIENAKKFLGQGDYRKSLLLVKNILQKNPNHLQSLYLSGLNWYHLQDRAKALHFLQQIFVLKPAYSPECYKMAAVCYSKTFEYNRSLACLTNCHKNFPQQAESYDIQGKVLGKVRKWEQASKAYQIGYDLSKNPYFLLNKAACYEQINQLTLALECYERLLQVDFLNTAVGIKKMQLHIQLHQFQEAIQLYQLLKKMNVETFNKKQMEEFYYMVAYSYYKLHKFSQSLIAIDEGIQEAENTAQFNKLLLMIRIHQRDLYQAFHLATRIKECPQLKILMKFVQGVIQLMRRNYQDGIEKLLSIQHQLGFLVQFTIDIDKVKLQKGNQVEDEFHNQIRKLYLMFLSYGYYNTSQFHICRKLASIQKIIGVPEYFQLGFAYNYQMCEGIINHCDKQFKQAQTHFQKAAKIYDNRLEPPFSLALNCLQIMVNLSNEEDKDKMAARANQYFYTCRKIVGKNNTNTAAGVYYFSSLLHGHLQEWREALNCIDESIDRSEDHYWRYFYVRGLLLSCVHSFREAINDLSLAVALSGVTRPECYLLRSKCLQIQGQGNEAFKDLQQYISLKPDDPEVHKYAGQLLFENGAFEDALVAFSHQPIALILENYDIFLTQGKSFFLLGRFKQALDIILQAQSLKYSQQVELDIKVIDILQSITRKKKDFPQIQKNIQRTFAQYPKLGKIFKTSDYHILKALCNVFEKSFDFAISSFLLAIQQKTQQLGHIQGEDQSGIYQNKKDLIIFTSQMKYNIVLCKIAKGQRQEAIKIYKQIVVEFDQPFYGDYVSFKKFLNRQCDAYKKDEVFPSRNKLSNFLDKIQLEFQSKNPKQKTFLQMKLCIPFPKVQPPEIFPSFDKNLLVRLSVLNVERKPEAPWVLRQNNSIKFTDKIQNYSRFQLQDSEAESSSTYQMISIDQSHIDPSQRSRRLKTSVLKHAEEGGRLSRMDS